MSIKYVLAMRMTGVIVWKKHGDARWVKLLEVVKKTITNY